MTLCGIILAKYGSARADFLEEAHRIMDAAKTEGVLLRLLGALAFHIHCPKFSYMQGRVRALFGSRLIFYDASDSSRHCDVFLDKLEFCHDVVFQGRLEVDDPTVPLAELLLEKMQIVKLNEKDAIDTIMLLREHQIGGSDDDTINADHLSRLTARDWGLWKTFTINLENVRKAVQTYEKLSEEDKKDVSSKITALRARIDNEPKTRGWKIRSQIGERRKWYRDVDELLRE
ncbi:MAG: hypothetical protein ABSA81_00305 [Candidatus Bathyarchaeia archaeon]